ncbi:MAG: LytTR family DNA-binding domain-containing protein [Pseudomonadota bacterium]
MLSTVVCDDERPALDLLVRMLTDTGCVTISGAYQSASEAVTRINEGGIDFAVLDIEMPPPNGLEAFDALTVSPRPLLVFATAHPEYALEAFEVDAIDYLLKPLDTDRVRKAVDKAVRLHGLTAGAESLEPAGPEVKPGALRVKDVGHVFLVPFEQVIWVEAAGDYSLVHTGEKEYALRKTLSALEKELPEGGFVRVHRSAIVQAAAVREVRVLPKGDAQITLSSGTLVKASRSYREAIKRLTDLPGS